MIHRYILHNADVCEASDRVLSPGQVGLLSGWGVFSTIRVTHGVLFAFERHWARMTRDAAAFHVTPPAEQEEVRRRLLKLVEANRAYDSSLRVVFVRNGGGMWQGPPVGRETDLIALTADSKNWGSGARLGYQTQARHSAGSFAGAKVLAWGQNLVWLEEAQAKGYDEVILFNERGEVAECTSANIFIAEGDKVWTPPLSSGCLPGVTREIIVNEIQPPGYTIDEKPLLPEDLDQADDVFITSTTRDLLPVDAIEGKPRTARGHARETLQKAFSAYVRRYVEEHR